MTSFNNPVILDILKQYRPIAAMTYSASLLNWDTEINMPEAGGAARGQAQAELEMLGQKITLSLADLVDKAGREKTLNDEEKGVLRITKRSLDYYRKIPPELVEELQKSTAEAAVPWRTARAKSDFQFFQPHPKKLTDLKLKQQNCLTP